MCVFFYRKMLMKNKPMFTLPVLVTEDDYHGFSILEEHLNKIFCSKITVEELGLNTSGLYVGMVYLGRRPKASVVAELKSKARLIEEDE